MDYSDYVFLIPFVALTVLIVWQSMRQSQAYRSFANSDPRQITTPIVLVGLGLGVGEG